MTVDAELAQWGEPPVSRTEEALMAFLDIFLERTSRGESVRPEDLLADFPDLVPDGAALVRSAACIEEFVVNVLEHSSILEDKPSAPGMATELDEGEPTVEEALPDPLPGRFRIRQSLGEGKFGKVWLADHIRFQIPVALKTLHFHVTGKDRDLALAALENEARVLARLQHPNIVRVYSLEQAGNDHYLVLQFVAGGSLQARLDAGGRLGWQLAARYIADVGEALLHVHAQGIIHRDVKLANILWDRQRDEALLTDFGLATRLEDSRHAAGTPLYMAPEAFEGKCTTAGDVYGLAASLFALLTGRVPFPAGTRDELLDRIRRGLPDPEPLFAGVPERLDRIVRSGLAAAPEQRQELGAFVADLRGSLNRLLADSFLLPSSSTTSPVALRLSVARWERGNRYMPVAATHNSPRGMTRDMTRVPPLPELVVLRTGDRVILEVIADRDGFLTVFNVGPAGRLNLLYPDPASVGAAAAPVPANQPLRVLDVAMTPPAGNERLFAFWSRVPLPLEKALELTSAGNSGASVSYRATRNMERVQESLQRLRREDWHAVVLELDHQS
jgi:tRNA A-37 threonylcarbamoyl transferase component Bud32